MFDFILAALLTASAPAAPAGDTPAPAKNICAQDGAVCILAPEKEIKALLQKAYDAGVADGLQACKIKSGSWL